MADSLFVRAIYRIWYRLVGTRTQALVNPPFLCAFLSLLSSLLHLTYHSLLQALIASRRCRSFFTFYTHQSCHSFPAPFILYFLQAKSKKLSRLSKSIYQRPTSTSLLPKLFPFPVSRFNCSLHISNFSLIYQFCDQYAFHQSSAVYRRGCRAFRVRCSAS